MSLTRFGLDHVSRLVARATCALLRRRHPEWADAMLREFDECGSTSERLGWAVGCVRTLAADTQGDVSMSYVAGLILSLAVVANMEWRTDEDLVTMAVLLAAGIGLGWLRPRLFLLSGLLLGLVVPALNLLTLATGIRPRYETALQASSHHAAYILSLLVLIIPALIASLIGRFIGQRAYLAPTG